MTTDEMLAALQKRYEVGFSDNTDRLNNFLGWNLLVTGQQDDCEFELSVSGPDESDTESLLESVVIPVAYTLLFGTTAAPDGSEEGA